MENIITYQQFQQILNSTSCHRVPLFDSKGNELIGVYNGLSYWGRVFQAVNGNEYNGVIEVANLSVNDATEETFHDGYFEEAGYQLGK